MAENIRRKRKELNILLYVLIIVFAFPIIGKAAEEVGTDLEIRYPKADSQIFVYKVAYPVSENQYELVESFENYEKEVLNLSNLKKHMDELSTTTKIKLAATLKNSVIADKMKPDYCVMSDAQGNLIVEKFEAGVYLVFGEKIELDGNVYLTMPLLFKVPEGTAEDKMQLDFTSKISLNNVDGKCTVMKIWKDNDSKEKRPENIEVILFRDGQQYDIVTLNEENNWEYTWKNLDIGSEWLIVEKEVPDGYKVAYESGKGYIAIENTSVDREKPETPDENIHSKDKIPQTGQLWWPVPMLAAIGIVLFSLGWAMKNREDRLGEE